MRLETDERHIIRFVVSAIYHSDENMMDLPNFTKKLI